MSRTVLNRTIGATQFVEGMMVVLHVPNSEHCLSASRHDGEVVKLVRRLGGMCKHDAKWWRARDRQGNNWNVCESIIEPA